MLEGGDGEWRGRKAEKKWDNCNSIINKIYLKKKTITVPYTFMFMKTLNYTKKLACPSGLRS